MFRSKSRQRRDVSSDVSSAVRVGVDVGVEATAGRRSDAPRRPARARLAAIVVPFAAAPLVAAVSLLPFPVRCAGQTTSPATAPSATAPATSPTTEPSGGTIAPTTLPLAPPATEPATQSSATQSATQPATSQVGRWTRTLSEGDWRQRTRARDELVRAGDAAVPALEALVRDAPSLDARSAAQEALRQIADNRVSGPSYVTLHLKDATPRRAFEQLARQSYTTLKTWPDNLWDQLPHARINADFDREPFWAVMRDLSAKSGLELRDINGEPRLMQGGGQAGGLPTVQGAFLVVANQVSRSVIIPLGQPGAATQDTFGIQFTLYAEPKLTVVRAPSAVKVEQATDDRGNSLLPAAGDDADQVGYVGGQGEWGLFARLRYPANAGARIARFRGSATFAVQTRSRKFEVDHLPTAPEHAEVINGMRVTFRDFKKSEGNTWTLHLKFGNPAPAAGAAGGALADWDVWQTNAQTRLKVLDANGQALEHTGFGSSGGADGMDVNLTFSPGQSLEGRASGEPVKLVWDIPTESRDVTVPFEFTDLPMRDPPPEGPARAAPPEKK